MQIRPLSESFQEKAARELNEDPKRAEEDITTIREWVKKQPHLTARQDDYFYLCFLRGCKFSLQRAKQKLDYFYTARTMLPEIFACRDPFSADVQLVLKSGGIVPLAKPTGATGSRVIIFRWGAFNPSTMPFTLLVKVAYMIIDILMQEDDHTIVSGIQFLVDYKNFPVPYTVQLTPTAVHKSSIGVQSAYPLRLKGMDIINVPSFFDAIYSIIKPVLTQKFRDRTKIYTDNYNPSLYDRIPQSILPKEYGGAEGTLEELRDIWKKKVESYSQWFKEDEKYCSNEDLRAEDSKSDVFGVDGSFRKLDID